MYSFSWLSAPFFPGRERTWPWLHLSLLQLMRLGVTCKPYGEAAGLREHGEEQLFPLLSLPQLVQSSTAGSGKMPCLQHCGGRAGWQG